MLLLLRTSKRFVTLGWQSHKICRKCPARLLNSLSLYKVLPLLQQNTRSFRKSFHVLNQRAQANSALDYNDDAPRASSFDEKFFKMDSAVKKQGRITVPQIQSIIADIKRLETVTSNQSLLLIRCCGSLLPEFPAEKRTILVDEIWKLITELGCPLDVSHYNTLLNVYLENEHKFDPGEFLSRMEMNNIIPNRVTYQRLIQRYCQDGDLEGASKLFEVLKTEGYPVNEAVFHHLILGHSTANNMDDAKKIFDVMRNSQLIPTAGAYCALARGYALHGDMDSVMSTLEEAEANNTALSDKELLSIIHTLAVHNFGDYIHQILPKLKKALGFNNDCLNLILELVNNGQHRIGFALLTSMSARNLADGSAAPSGEFFIRQIIKMNVPPEIVLDYCNKLKEDGLNDTALLRATKLVLLLEKPDYAICFLKGLYAQKHFIRTHFFWPIFIAKKNENETEMYSVLRLMLELECPADIETLKDYVFPHLNFDDPFAILNTLLEIGQDVQLSVNALIIYLLHNLDDVESSLKLLEKYPGSVNRTVLDRISSTLAKINVRKGNANLATVLNVLKYATVSQQSSAEPTRYQNPVDIYGHFLVEYLQNKNVEALKTILLAMKEQNCTITKSSENSILTALDEHRNDDMKELQGLVQSLISAEDLGDSIGSTPEFGNKESKTSVGELEAALDEMMPNSEGRCEILKKILISRCKERDIKRVESVLEELKQHNFPLTAGLLSMLLNMYSFEYKLDQACHYHKLLESEFPTFILETFQLLNMATVFAKEQKFEEMDKFLSLVSSRSNSSRNHVEMNVRRLLQAVSEAGQPEKTRQVFDLCIGMKLCHPTPRVMGYLIISHLVKNDVNGAIEELKRISNLYACAPAAQQICKKLIEQESTDQLQEVMELSSKHYGEVNAMLDLACSFLELDRIKQAKMILSTPGLQPKSEKMDYLCESFLKANKVDCLENFVELTKDIFDVDRDKMFQHLIKGYAKTENVDKALGVWVQMQEENVHPSDHTLHLLGTFLKRMNKTPPFSYSEEPTESVVMASRSKGQVNQTRNDQNSNSDPTFLQKMLESGDLTDAVEHVLKYNNNDMRKNHKDVISLATTLSELGNVNAIQQLQDIISPYVNLFLTDQLGKAYLNCGRGKEFLHSLETDVDKYKKFFPELAILSLLDAYPEDIDKIKESLNEKYTEHIDRIENIIWAYHVKAKKFDEADSIFQSSPELQRHIIMRPLLDYCQKSNDEKVSKKMFEVVKRTEMSNRAKGKAASTHVNVLVSGKKLDEAVDFILSELNSMEQKYLNHGTLTHLDSVLTAAGKTLPAMANLIRNANFDWKKV